MNKFNYFRLSTKRIKTMFLKILIISKTLTQKSIFIFILIFLQNSIFVKN